MTKASWNVRHRLGLDVLANYVSLNPETQARNIAAWTPVCTEILQGFCRFEEEPVSFSPCCSHSLT
jgi:hypothetical protein